MKRAIQELKINRERNERRLLEFEKLWPAEQARGVGVAASISELRVSNASIDRAIDVLERYERGGIVDPVLDFQRQHPGAFVPSDRKIDPGFEAFDNLRQAHEAAHARKGQTGPAPASSYPGMLHGQSLDERADARFAPAGPQGEPPQGAVLLDGDGGDE